MVERTWDGEPVSREAPFGAAVVVCRHGERGPELLVLHRAQLGPDFEGDWAWGPPSGARYPGESIAVCAARELREETGLRLPLRPAGGPGDWAVYLAEAPRDAEIRLSPEHDRFAWLPIDEAVGRTSPADVRAQLAAATAGIG
ncbi:MAG TPA: NUDIX domain-containing protein [Thermomicrobiaceae bacterium]|nr:NUDIX domain-containing protein [Thermomicrobiaceae bacterium]